VSGQKMANTKEKNKGGRPRKKIDYGILENLCQIQATGDECAAVLGMNYDTLSRNLKVDGHGGFPDYYKKHSAVGRASLRRKQMQVAMSGDKTLLVWLGKNYLEQKDRQELSGDKDNPIKVDVSGLIDKLKRMAK